MKTFEFKVLRIDSGWCYVEMSLNGKTIKYRASYLGAEPLAQFIDACADIIFEQAGSSNDCDVAWDEEPGWLEININLKDDNLLFNIKCDDGREWHETVLFDDFVSEVISEGLRVLREYGLRGYRQAWANDMDFPLANLLSIIMKGDKFEHDHSDINKELECLLKAIKKQ